MNAQDTRKIAKDAYKDAWSRINEFAEKAADAIVEDIWTAKWGYSSQRFDGGMQQYDVPSIVEPKVAPKVFAILVNRGYKVEYNHYTGWWWNRKPEYLG